MYLLESIEKELPEINIFLYCKFEHLKKYFNTNRIIIDQFDKRQFAYIHNLKCNMIDHPVEKLINESNITLKYLNPPKISIKTKRCLISPKAMLPAKSLTNNNIEDAKRLALLNGFDPVVGTNIEGASWVIAPENESLFLAATKGIKTTLVPTGIGTNFYKRIFPDGEIWE